MEVIRQLPHSALAPYVRCYWEITHELASDEMLDVPFGTTGRTHVVIPLVNTFMMTYGPGRPRPVPLCGLFGQVTQPVVKHIAGFTRVLVIDFTATSLHSLWPMPINALMNGSVEMAEVVGPDVRALTERLLNTADAPGRVRVLEAYLLRRLRRVTTTDGRVEAAVQQIGQQLGFIHIGQLAQQLNCTERTLNRRFTECVGVPPKLYARVQRFLKTRSWLEQHPKQGWHAVLTTVGYYDQAHLIHEFRQFTGQSPRLYGADHKPLHDFLRQE